MEGRLKALEAAISKIGVEEVPRGSNWGKDVQEFLLSVKIKFPASWCQAFVYWCYKKGFGDAQNPCVQTGGVLDCWNRSIKQNKITVAQAQANPALILPGYQFIMDFGNGLGHTGIVEKVEGGKVYTIEGNTNDTGSREGYAVCRRVRKVSDMKGFIKY